MILLIFLISLTVFTVITMGFTNLELLIPLIIFSILRGMYIILPFISNYAEGKHFQPLKNYLDIYEETKCEQEEDFNLPEIEVPKIDPTLYEHDTFPHTLLYGAPGLGKTTLVNIIVYHLKEIYGHEIFFYYFTPSEVRTKYDLDRIFQNLNYHDVICADEIHGFPQQIGEALYSAIQDGRYVSTSRDEVIIGNFILGSESGFKSVNEIHLPPFTFVGGTTERGLIPEPLEDRFKIILELQPYSEEELAEIVEGYVRKGGAPTNLVEYIGQERGKALIKLNLEVIAGKELRWDKSTKRVDHIITPEASLEIARRSLHIPRLAKRLTDHVMTYAKRYHEFPITKETIEKASDMLPLDEYGLRNDHIRIIQTLLESQNYTLGRKALAAAVRTSINNIEERIIPQLTYSGWLTRNNRQMVTLTEKALHVYGSLKNKKYNVNK